MNDPNKPSGLSEFKAFVEEFKGVSGLVLGGAAVAPFLTSALLGFAPPGISFIEVLTAILQLLILILIFHFLRRTTRRVVSVCLITSTILLVISFSLYFTFFNTKTIILPTTNERIVIGNECTDEAKLLLPTQCQQQAFTRADFDLFGGEYNALWIRNGTLTNLGILSALWFLTFGLLTFVVSLFCLHYMTAP